ncbi:MAG: cadherin domain-containing protein, partial [Deltaproteobacteria bacterium]|nr:cadherin domain-containing protein [Deltaproteobacteria bacterium]
VMANDTDAEGDPLKAALVSDVSSGSLSFAPDGSFVYTPDPDFAGTDSFTYELTDGSGTSNVATVTLTVNPVNDAPVLVPFGPDLTPIEDADTANGGDLVSAILAGSVTDVDGDLDLGVAITGLSSGNGKWEFKVGAGAWTAVPVVDVTSALLLAGSDRIRFVPGAIGDDSASFTYYGWDGTVGAAGTLADASTTGADAAFSLAADTGSIAVSRVNEAPVLSPPGADLPGITEDETANVGEQVSVILAGVVSDANAGDAIGLAITSLSSGNGRWQYRVGAGVWMDVGSVAEDDALLLGATDRVRFVPNRVEGTTASFTYRAWDETVGSAGSRADATLTGGSTAFSVLSGTASIDVADLNDPPTLRDGALPAVLEDSVDPPGSTVSAIFAGKFTDRDGSVAGVAVIANTADGLVQGRWQYSTNLGADWFDIGTVGDDATALVLDLDAMLRFVPVPDFSGAPGGLQMRAVDDTYGGGFSSTLGIESRVYTDASQNGGTTPVSRRAADLLTWISPVNDAPELTPFGSDLTPITEDDVANGGDVVSAILGGSATDADGDAPGIAVTGLSSGNGTWQYRVGAGVWTDVGSVAEDDALLLGATDRIRFVPTGAEGTTASFSYRAWDETVGSAGSRADATLTGGSTAFSVSSGTAAIDVADLNDPPTLRDGALPAVLEDSVDPPGSTVSAIFAGKFTDRDGSMAGVAVIANTADGSVQGRWEYSTNLGGDWFDIGTVADDATALVLDVAAMLRFVPVADFNGAPGGLQVRGVDDSYGGGFSSTLGIESRVYTDASQNGGTTPLSRMPADLLTWISPVNDAPQVSGGPFVVAEGAPTGTVVGSVSTIEVDTGDTLSYAITGGNTGNAFAIDSSGQITVVDPAPLDFETNPSFDLRVEVTDDGTPSMSGTATVTVSLTNVNETPTVVGGPFNIDEGAPNGTALGAVVGTDDDAGQTLSYDIVGGNTGNAFAIDAGSGMITVADSAVLDFETNPSFDLVVEVRDDGVPSASSTSTVRVTLNDMNDAPVLAAASPALAPISEDDTGNAGQTVAAIVGATISDDDASAIEGIAITGLSSGNGSWQYRLGAGPWSAVGAAADDDALLLRSGDAIRFVPDAQNADAGSVSFRAWDRTSGTAGARADATVNGARSAFSSGTNSASISVAAANDAPSLGAGALASTPENSFDPAGAALASVFSGAFSDVDSGAGLAGVAVVGNSAPAAQGAWQYSSDGGANWSAVGAVSDGPGALALDASSLVRFVPALGFSGVPTDLIVRALDDTYAGTFSTTSGGGSRVFVDTGGAGGTSPIGTNRAAISTSVTAGSDLPGSEVDPDPDPDAEPEPDGGDPLDEDDGVPPGGGSDTDPLPGDPGDGPEAATLLDIEGTPGSLILPGRAERLIVQPGTDALSRQTAVRGERGDLVRAEGASADGFWGGLFGVKLPSGMTLAEFLSQSEFREELDRVQTQLGEFARLDAQAMTSAIGITAALSAGYLLWLTQGGLLLASLVSSMPAWRLIDPVPILSRRSEGDEDGRDEGESLGSLLSRAADGGADAGDASDAEPGNPAGVDENPRD